MDLIIKREDNGLMISISTKDDSEIRDLAKAVLVLIEAAGYDLDCFKEVINDV